MTGKTEGEKGGFNGIRKKNINGLLANALPGAVEFY